MVPRPSREDARGSHAISSVSFWDHPLGQTHGCETCEEAMARHRGVADALPGQRGGLTHQPPSNYGRQGVGPLTSDGAQRAQNVPTTEKSGQGGL